MGLFAGRRRSHRMALARERAAFDAAAAFARAAREGVATVHEALERAVRSAEPSCLGLTIWSREGEVLRCVHASASRYARFPGAGLARTDENSPLSQALHSRAHVLVPPRGRHFHPGDRWTMVIPYRAGAAEGIATIALADEPDLAVRERLVAYVDLATPALELARERTDDRARATYDGLTGLLLPSPFRARLASLLASPPPLRASLVFIDADHFKAWNDRYGHGAGDRLLRELATLLQAAAREPGDLVARNGGDEFCIVWRDCEKSRAIARAESLRASIASAPFDQLLEHPDGAVRITASMGVAAYPVDATTSDALLEAADAAMYDAKRAGRNQVVFRTNIQS